MYIKSDQNEGMERSFVIARDDVTYTIKHNKGGRYVDPNGPACFKHRQCDAAIFKGQEYIGYLSFNCYKFDSYEYDPKEFVYIADALDGDMHELAAAFTACWSFSEQQTIISLGYLLEFSRVQIKPEYRPCFVWVDAAEHLIKTIFRQHSVMMMIAAPFEMQPSEELRRKIDLTKEDKSILDAHHTQRENYRKHMIKAYHRLLDVKSLPANYGEDGWLWRPRSSLRNMIPKPHRVMEIDPYD